MSNDGQPTTISGSHCQQCGSTDAEDVGMSATRESEGYSLCCNEIVTVPDQVGGYRNGRWVYNVSEQCNPAVCYHE